MTNNTTRVSRQINAPRLVVYRALLDAQAIAAWKVPTGMTSVVHEFEAREGGSFRVSLTYDEPGNTGKTSAHTDTYHGHFEALIPDRQVVEVMRFESDDPAMNSEMRVTYTLSDVAGGTELLAIHENVPPGVAPADNELGWRLSLDKLAAYVEKREVK